MRVAMLAYSGSVHTRRWATFLSERGHDVHVITCGQARHAPPLDVNAPYAVHDLGRPPLGRAGYLTKVRSARALVRALRPDVVHAHYATSYGMLAVLAGQRPLVVTAHGDDVLIAPRNRLMRRIVRHVLSRADLVTVPAEHMRREVERLTGGGSRQLVVFQYGVDTARLAAEAPRRGGHAPRPTMRIVTSRPLLALYRTDSLLRALALLTARGTTVRCDVAGEGPDRSRLERLVAELGLDGEVRLHGHLAERDTELLMAQADIYVSVAASDGASLSLLEAMALGLVPVLSDIPANREWVTDGRNGILVGEDPAAIADGLVRALALDAADVARRNLAIARDRADRATNLGRFETMILSLAPPAGAAQ